MNHRLPQLSSRRHSPMATLTLVACLLSAGVARAVEVPAVLDDFSDPQHTSGDVARILVDDASIGGGSHANQTIADGVMTVEGELVPARGQPGFVSVVLLLSPAGEPCDVSKYEGVRIKARVTKGVLSVLATSSEIENFDFHATVIPRAAGEIREYKVPFVDLKRVWSEQTALNLKTIVSINLVASGLEKGAFAYEVDEVGFY